VYSNTDEEPTELINGDEPIKYLATCLFRIREIVEPIIDAAVRQSGQAKQPSEKPEGA
jgi:hypothetical protein